MLPASNNGGGSCATTGPTDVCKTIVPVGPPVPLPYPNFAQNSQVQGSSASSRVKIVNKKTVVVSTYIYISTGDEPGTALGVVSNKIKGKCTFKVGSSKVFAEGKKICYHGSVTGMNGTPDNTVGLQVAPSQMTVFVAP